MTSSDREYTLREAAALTGVNLETLRKRASRDQLPTCRNEAGERLITHADLAAHYPDKLAMTSEQIEQLQHRMLELAAAAAEAESAAREAADTADQLGKRADELAEAAANAAREHLDAVRTYQRQRQRR